MKSNNLKDQVLAWYAYGECGISSKAMACAVLDMKTDARWAIRNHPLDPDDFRRCSLFLDAVPLAWQHMRKVAKLSPIWHNLVDHWDELERLLDEETKGSRLNAAPKLYARMKQLGATL